MVEINNTSKEKIDLDLAVRVAEEFLKRYKKTKYDVSIAFVEDKEIQNLNKTYRGINKPTDVLSFAGEDDFLGEIIISYPQIKRQARELGKSAKAELVFILVHGLLHLIGYNDETEEEREEMVERGEEFVRGFNF